MSIIFYWFQAIGTSERLKIILSNIVARLTYMKKVLLIVPIVFLWISCHHSTKVVNKVEVVKEYINALNESNYDGIVSLFKDSVRMKELVYSSVFSKKEYYQLFQWDSTFHPTYKILEIKEENGLVRMTVSKECPRIFKGHQSFSRK